MSKSAVGILSAIAGGLAVFALVQFTSLGGEAHPPVRLNIQDTPIDRETRGLTSFAPIIKRAAPSVVNIYSTRIIRQRWIEVHPLFNDPFFRRFFDIEPRQLRSRPQKAQNLGSGVIVSSNGYILTANHVVEGADEIRVALPSSGREFEAKVVGTDPATDIALLKVDADDLPAITIADSDNLEVGDIVLAIGNPFNVGQTVTMGIVSALGRTSLQINAYENFIQTDAAINPGNSGGALVDAEGRLVGINTAIYSRSGGNQGVGFAVPINLARSVMEGLVEHGEVLRGYLGVTLQMAITPDLVEAFNLPDASGAMVVEVGRGTPAAKAGLQNGDVIREFNGKKVNDRPHLRLLVAQTPPGTKVTLKILRGGEPGKKPVEREITVTLGRMPEEYLSGGLPTAPHEDDSAGEYDALDGVVVSDLDSNARQRFGIPSHVRGALVTSVDPDSNSAEAGLRPGDVILEINRKPVADADEAVRLSENLRGDRVLLRIWRDRSSMYLTVDNRKRR
ncbi:MAG TPA: DegQ family serine endoprotease [Verrucomicrobia bacterium]|mgnify:FL=1|nr:DegQ family serine endoprotease [Verrucomicrobiota bacterium]HOB31676.1 DegQ family serine endoprotease [Verrucomicrobiota bacterium]HOP97938.1 DegQ family serine endoprotease [Verrucomicrobiota bacterium]HPU55772.1 DegQ family serine endoprotease [Verrucomicrobiota bacterium]